MVFSEQLLHIGESMRRIAGITIDAVFGDQFELALHPLCLSGGEFGAVGREYAHLTSLVRAQ